MSWPWLLAIDGGPATYEYFILTLTELSLEVDYLRPWPWLLAIDGGPDATYEYFILSGFS